MSHFYDLSLEAAEWQSRRMFLWVLLESGKACTFKQIDAMSALSSKEGIA